MSPLSWGRPTFEDADLDRQAETGQLPDEFFGRIDFAAAFGVCADQPSVREREQHRTDHLANRDARAASTAGRRDHPWRNHE